MNIHSHKQIIVKLNTNNLVNTKIEYSIKTVLW